VSMIPLIRCVFWLCCGILLYVYVLYPVLIRVLAACFGRAVVSDDRQPTVTIIVTAYNEEISIQAKLDNLAELNYPSGRFDVLVVSDASSDATERIAATYDPRRVRVLRVEGRLGKTACQNAAAAAAFSEILVFTDATTRVDPDAVKHLVGSFADPSVGCVAGCLAYVSESDSLTGRGGRTYWSYELGLRAAESALGSLIGVSGCLYAVRKSAYRPIDPTLISDFVVAMKMREQHLRTVLAPDAACFEATLDRGSEELSMRVRVAIRSLNALFRERRFLNPVKFGVFAWQLWSHKALRYASPLFWLGAYVSNALLVREAPYPLYLVLLLGQSAVLAAAGIGFVLQGRRQELGIFGKPYYFFLTNLAALIAILRYARGERMVTWKPIR
jgi:cellulose synthase/poly-beta-1,6-N-acetylglucosamine synthase-like glycosyltransferase